MLAAPLRTPFRRACPPGGYPYMPHVSHGLPADLSPGSSLMPHNNNVNNMDVSGAAYSRPASMVGHPYADSTHPHFVTGVVVLLMFAKTTKDQLIHRPTHPQTNSSTDQLIHRPTHPQTNSSTDQLIYRPTHP